MKVTVDFNEFNKVFNTVKLALNNKGIKEENRKVTLIADKDKGVLVVSSFTTLSTIRGTIDCTVVDQGEAINLKSSEIGNILGVFQGMSKTHATEIDFESVSTGKTRVVIHEEPNDEADADLSNSSSFTLMNQSVPHQHLGNILQELPNEDEFVELSKENTLFTIGTLIKQMSAELNSKNNLMNFAKDYVFVATEGLSVVRNNLEGYEKDKKILEEVSFSYNQVQIISAMLTEDTTVRVARKERTIFFDNGVYCAFLQTNRMNAGVVKLNVDGSPFDRNIEKKQYDGFVVNKPYLQDILRRAELSGTTVGLSVEEGYLEVSGVGNNDFKHKITLEHERGVEGVGFTIPVSIIKGSIVDNPMIVTENLFVYVTETNKPNQKKLYFMDDTDSWVSVMVVSLRKNL